MNEKILEISKNTCDFLWDKNNFISDSNSLKKETNHLYQALTGLFNTIANSMQKKEEIFLIGKNDQFEKDTQKAILLRFNVINHQEDFLNFLFKQIKNKLQSGSIIENCWQLMIKNELLIIKNKNPKINIELPPEGFVKAKAIKLSNLNKN